MRKLKIGNRYGARHIMIAIEDDKDAVTILEILAKNDIPATLYIDITEVKESNE